MKSIFLISMLLVMVISLIGCCSGVYSGQCPYCQSNLDYTDCSEDGRTMTCCNCGGDYKVSGHDGIKTGTAPDWQRIESIKNRKAMEKASGPSFNQKLFWMTFPLRK